MQSKVQRSSKFVDDASDQRPTWVHEPTGKKGGGGGIGSQRVAIETRTRTRDSDSVSHPLRLDHRRNLLRRGPKFKTTSIRKKANRCGDEMSALPSIWSATLSRRTKKEMMPM